ncbi:MAG: zf-HC2 domain-containing protein [bacterium]
MTPDATECSHPDIEVLLSDYYTGHLDETNTRLVKLHLSECRPCRQSLRMMAAISGKLAPPEGDDLERHYSPQLLGRFFADPRSLDAELVRRIEQHISHCDECAADLRFLQDSDKDLRSTVSIGPGHVRKLKTTSWFRRLFGKKGS